MHVAVFGRGEDGDGHGLRAARNIAGQHEGRAEFSERSRKRQHRSCNHARSSQRNNTLRSTAHSEAPSVRAASRSVGLTCSNPASVVRYMSGNATTVAAMTVAGHENTIVMPMCSSATPSGLLRPKINSRKKPTTVGGRTSGSVRMPSIHARKLREPRTWPSRQAGPKRKWPWLRHTWWPERCKAARDRWAASR